VAAFNRSAQKPADIIGNEPKNAGATAEPPRIVMEGFSLQ
jgi:hypothetical protein